MSTLEQLLTEVFRPMVREEIRAALSEQGIRRTARLSNALLTRGDVAKRLGCCMRTVDKLVREGKLPVCHPAERLTRFQSSDVDALLASLRTQGASVKSKQVHEILDDLHGKRLARASA